MVDVEKDDIWKGNEKLSLDFFEKERLGFFIIN